jgi:hypothetical protein
VVQNKKQMLMRNSRVFKSRAALQPTLTMFQQKFSTCHPLYIVLAISTLTFSSYHPNQTEGIVNNTIPEMPIEMRKIQDSIDQHYLGVAGTGFIGKDEFIGFCEAEKSDGGPWLPLDGYKHTVCGKIPLKQNRLTFSENSDDGDIDIYIYPNLGFEWLLTKSLRPSGSFFEPNAIGGEVAFKEPGNLPENDGAEFFKILNSDIFINNDVCLYGPWVSDKGHKNQPEIHPVQQMWFTKLLSDHTKEYHLYSMYDNSKRFNDPTDFKNCSSSGWISIPLVNTFYISFTIPLTAGRPRPEASSPEYSQYSLGYYREIYTIEMPSSNNINLYPPESNEFKVDALGKTRIIVKKVNDQYPKVSVSDLWQYKGNLRGFIKIETSIMKPYTGNNPIGAHAFLKVTKKRVTVAPAMGF